MVMREGEGRRKEDKQCKRINQEIKRVVRKGRDEACLKKLRKEYRKKKQEEKAR